MSNNLLDYVGLGYFLSKIKTLFVTGLGTSGNSLTWTKNGTTNNVTVPYATKSSELVPLQTKQYTGVIGTANNNPGAVFYFMSIHPDDWNKPCRVVYKISAEMSGQTAGKAFSIMSIVFSRNTAPAYDVWNYIGHTDYRPYYYHYRYLMTSTGHNNNYGHLMGIGLNSSYSPTSATYARDFKIEVLEATDCTVTLFDTMTKYANVPGTGSTNYSGETTYNATTQGETHSGDINDVNYQNREYYGCRKTNSALYRYTLCLTKSDGSLVPLNSVSNTVATTKELTSDSFDPFGEIFYWNSTATYSAGANVGDGSWYRQILFDARYSFNTGGYSATGTLVARSPVYLVAVPRSDGTAVLNSTPLVLALPTEDDGLIYIYLGRVYPDNYPYRISLSLNHPVYYFKDGGIRPWAATKDVHNYKFDYLTFLALSEGTFTYSNIVGGLQNSNNKISYSLDNGKTWSTESDNVSLSVSLGDKVLWKGNLSTTFGGVCTFGGTASFEVSGNLLSVLFGDSFLADNTIDSYRACGSIFEGSNCVSASNLILPVNLCNSMFNRMFYGCTSLTTAPKLPATTLANYCYSNMFYGCTSLTTTPELPATSLANGCYNNMFYGCTSLTIAPELPATTLVSGCYTRMFSSCSKLNYIKALFTTTPSSSYTSNWVSGVATSGVFIKNNSATWTTTGNDAVPTSWVTCTEDEYEVVRHYELATKENTSNKVTSLSAASTNTLYPSAKLLYDLLALKLDDDVVVACQAVDYGNGTVYEVNKTFSLITLDIRSGKRVWFYCGDSATPEQYLALYRLFPLTYADYSKIEFSNNFATFKISSSNVVTLIEANYESTTNKVTSLSVSSTNTQYPSAKCVYDAINNVNPRIPITNHGTSDTTFALTPNIYHKWGSVSTLTLTLATPSDNTVLNEYMFSFVSPSTPTTLSLPASVNWAIDLQIEPNKTYLITIIDDLATFVTVDMLNIIT